MLNTAAVAKPMAPKSAPASGNLIATKAKDAAEWEKWSQNFDVPIDEIKPITVHVSPTYDLDHIESVTLKSFRKIVGYDTFNSIRKGDRDEKKDTSDYYNVTVSFLVRRKSIESLVNACGHHNRTVTEKIAPLADKGFPYDDADRDEALIKAMNHANKAVPAPSGNSTQPDLGSDANLMITSSNMNGKMPK